MKNTRLQHLENLGKMGKLIATYDWSKTALGDSSQWSQNLITVIDELLSLKEFQDQSSQSISDLNEQFRSYLEDSPNPFFSLDTNWIITYMNPPAFEVLGVSKEEVVGKLFWDTFPGLQGTIFEEHYFKAMFEQQKSSFEGYYANFDRWYEVTAYPLVQGMTVYFQDITERKKLEMNLSATLRIRDDFLSTASHELRTPLTSLKLQTQWMMRDISTQKNIDSDRVEKFVRLADKQITRLSRLIDDMVDVSRITAGKLLLHREKMDFSVLLKEALERFEHLFVDHPSGMPELEIYGENFVGEWDSFRLEQVINNLISNSYRYGNNKPIKIILEEKKDKILFSVIDQGIGIQKKDKKTIFEQFARVESGPILKEGMGLGLFISKHIVEAHGGIISVESTVKQGSTFTVELPRS